MKVAILQSSYIPWKGYFDIIHDVELFIFYDDVQFTRRDWRSRNRIRTRQGLLWLSVPTFGDRTTRICDVELADPRWQKKHWDTLRHVYGRAPYFQRYQAVLEHAYLGSRWTHLSEMNQHLVALVARDLLGVRTTLADSRSFQAEGTRQDRILSVLRSAGASAYVSGPSARSYLDGKAFEAAGIELIWKDYTGYPEYPQLSAPFEHGVSVLDLLFRVGPDAPYYIWGWRDERSGRQLAVG